MEYPTGEAVKSEIDAHVSAGDRITLACEHMARELVAGVSHGFFEMVVTVETTQAKKRQIMIRAGKSYRFVV